MNEALERAQKTYNSKCKMVQVRVNKETETDILEWIERGQAATRIKELIRADLKKNPVK